MATQEINAVVPQKWTSESRGAAAEDFERRTKREGISMPAYAAAIRVNPKTFANWVYKFRGTIGSRGPARKSGPRKGVRKEARAAAVTTEGPVAKTVAPEPPREDETFELRRQLENAHAKIAALQEVVLVLGHQLTE